MRTGLLEHGYIELVESWGSDERAIESARMSTGKGFLGWGTGRCLHCDQTPEACVDRGLAGDQCPDGESHTFDRGDEKLLRYLYENHHDTPFEMAGMIVEVRAPIFVFREWHRHRVPWSYNEASARYAPLPALDYMPSRERCLRGAEHQTKQASKSEGAAVLGKGSAEKWLRDLQTWQEDGETLYQNGLKAGVPKELSRLAMSVGRFSTMRASANLRGWLHFLSLRSAPNAQEEIRVYADAAANFLRELFPRTMALHDEGKR